MLSSTNPSDATGVNNTYTWTAVNNSRTIALNGVTLGSHCSGQGASEIPLDAHFGVWCTPATGVTLLPGESVSGSVTLRPGAGGAPDCTANSLYIDPKTGASLRGASEIPFIRHSDVVAAAPTDLQIKGAASNGAPPAGSAFTYTSEIKNAGP